VTGTTAEQCGVGEHVVDFCSCWMHYNGVCGADCACVPALLGTWFFVNGVPVAYDHWAMAPLPDLGPGGDNFPDLSDIVLSGATSGTAADVTPNIGFGDAPFDDGTYIDWATRAGGMTLHIEPPAAIATGGGGISVNILTFNLNDWLGANNVDLEEGDIIRIVVRTQAAALADATPRWLTLMWDDSTNGMEIARVQVPAGASAANETHPAFTLEATLGEWNNRGVRNELTTANTGISNTAAWINGTLPSAVLTLNLMTTATEAAPAVFPDSGVTALFIDSITVTRP
jgi:hypothetical protein